MKRTVLIALCVLTLLFICGCDTKKQNETEVTNNMTGTYFTFINEVAEADVWVLPQTEENMKTSLWGTASASKVKTGESRQTPLCAPGDDGLYIFRMIDTDSFYYSANGITLEEGWILRIKEADIMQVTIEVTDENGTLMNTYEVFSAKL